MNFKKLALCTVLTLSTFTIGAHEGHDSGMAKSVHGGIVKKTSTAYVEVVQDEGIEIYVTDHSYKNLITPKLAITALADIKGKKVPLKLDSKNTHYVVGTNLSKEKHFMLKISLKLNGKDEVVVFPLEN